MKKPSGTIPLLILAASILAGCAKTPDATQHLFDAIEAADLAAVRQAIADGAKLDALDQYERTPLEAALRKNDAMQLVPLLVRAGVVVPADIFATAGGACRTPELINLLTGLGADVNAGGGRALIHAASFFDPGVIRFLLDKGLDVNARGDSGNTALMFAALRETPDVMACLLAAGADVNAVNNNGKTVFMNAVEFHSLAGGLANAAALLAAGADVNAADREGRTALLAAAREQKNPEVISFLLANGADANVRASNSETTLTALFRQQWGETEHENLLQCMELLLAAGADVNAATRSGTVLMRAASSDNIPAVVLERLLAAGAKIDAVDRFGHTALIRAARFRRVPSLPVFECLLAAGTDVNARDSESMTPLMYLAKGRMGRKDWCAEHINLLLDAGADINARTLPTAPAKRRGWTALMFAAMQGNQAACDTLLAAGADASLKDDEGRTAANHAATLRLIDALLPDYPQALADGADINGFDVRGFTPLITAIAEQDPARVDFLIRHGADANAYSDNRFLPLYAAVNRGVPDPPDKDEPILEHGSFWFNQRLLQRDIKKQARIVRLLLEAGVDPNGGYPGTSIILPPLCAPNLCVRTFDLLMKHGADINQPVVDPVGDVTMFLTETGQTPLTSLLAYTASITPTGNEPALLAKMLRHGADVNARDAQGRTALMFAAACENPALARLLLNAGADKTAKDNVGKTALDFLKANRALKKSPAYPKLLKALE